MLDAEASFEVEDGVDPNSIMPGQEVEVAVRVTSDDPSAPISFGDISLSTDDGAVLSDAMEVDAAIFDNLPDSVSFTVFDLAVNLIAFNFLMQAPFTLGAFTLSMANAFTHISTFVNNQFVENTIANGMLTVGNQTFTVVDESVMLDFSDHRHRLGAWKA